MRSCSSSQRFHSIHDCHGCLHLTDWFVCQRTLQQPQRTNLLTSSFSKRGYNCLLEYVISLELQSWRVIGFTGFLIPASYCFYVTVAVVTVAIEQEGVEENPRCPLVFHVFSPASLWKQHFILWVLELISCWRMIPPPKCSFLFHKHRCWSYCITCQEIEDTRRS